MSIRLGLVGATGVVGDVVLRLLEERRFPVGDLRLFASRRSAGQRIAWSGRQLEVEALEDADLGGLDVVISSIDSSVAREWVPRIVEAGAVVIDNSSAFRQDPDVPLVIPEINGRALRSHRGIVANPNCTTATALMALAPLHREAGLRAVISSSYQSVSGTGKEAVAELLDQARKAVDQVEALYGHEPLDVPPPQVYRHPLAFNLFPQCETFPPGADASTEEEKMALETRKILEAPDVEVHATAVRVPVLVGHSVSLAVSLGREVTPDRARSLIDAFPGARVLDDPQEAVYPTPLGSAGLDDVLVGRIRTNPILRNGLSLFVSGDNLRKGAALNAVQIAELLVG
ncbi:MAG TPA: aspartate-semialdehyde dehydrogenase [Actinomycetota bacterium]|nr:aspartate-semialdehyde dehydrogenase [Actinomycetota bacterium]